MKKISISISFFIVAFAISIISGCDGSKDPQWEASKKELVEKYLATAQGISHGEITVDSVKKSVTIENLKIEKNVVDDKGKKLLSVAIGADKLVATNVNFVDDPKDIIDIAENATLTNVTYRVALDPDLPKVFRFIINGNDKVTNASSHTQEVTLKQIRDDAELFLKRIAEENISIADIQLFGKFHIGSVVAKNIISTQKIDDEVLSAYNAAKGSNLRVSIEEVSFKDASLEGLQDYQLTNYSANVEDKKVIVLEKSTVKKIAIPNMLAHLDTKDVKKFFSQEIFIENAKAQNLHLFCPYGEVIVKEMNGNFTKKNNEIAFSSSYNNIVIPADFFDNMAQPVNIGKFSDLYNKPLDLSAAFDIKGTVQDNGDANFTVSGLELKDANLGSINFQLALAGKNFRFTPEGIPPINVEKTQLNNAKLLFQDKGIIDLGFAFASMFQSRVPLEQAKESGKAMRTLISGLFPNMCTGSLGAGNKALCDEVAKIVKAPGSLEISVTPENPILLDTGMSNILLNPTEAGVTAKYTN